MKFVVLFALVACAFADDAPAEETKATKATKYAYHGHYPGSCTLDGLYYQDIGHFVMCTGGISYAQACSPGTESSAEEKYIYGSYYALGDFCNSNLLVAAYNPVVNTYHAPLNTYIAPVPSHHAALPTHHAAVPSYHAAVPSYHAPLPVHKAPVVEELPEEVEVVETEVEAGFSRSGLYEGYGQQDGKFVFRGKYADSCKLDGLYYRDYQTYVICSNNNAYVQPCAPGTRNSIYGKYASGGYYSYADFCDVNLTDFGYAAKRSAFNYEKRMKYPLGYGYGLGLKSGYGLGLNGGYGHGLKNLKNRSLKGLGLGYGRGYGYGY